VATEILDTYNSLKTCQINNLIPVDPLSTTITSIVTGSNSQSNLSNYSIESSLKFLIYAYYQRYLLDQSKRIYTTRLRNCLDLTGTLIATEEDESAFTPYSPDIIYQKTTIIQN
jgi:xanthine/uracil/vitamin C permease (AzgA family)